MPNPFQLHFISCRSFKLPDSFLNQSFTFHARRLWAAVLLQDTCVSLDTIAVRRRDASLVWLLPGTQRLDLLTESQRIYCDSLFFVPHHLFTYSVLGVLGVASVNNSWVC